MWHSFFRGQAPVRGRGGPAPAHPLLPGATSVKPTALSSLNLQASLVTKLEPVTPPAKEKEEVLRARFSLALILQLPLFVPLGAFIYELEHVPSAGRSVLRASSPCPRLPAQGRSAESQAWERQS